MSRVMRAFQLSPSDCHRALMDDAIPSLGFTPGADVLGFQRALRAELQRLVGFEKMPTARVPLEVSSVWRREHELGSIEKVVFTAEPGADVPAYVCLPHGARTPHRFVVCLQGHSTGMHNSIGVAQDDETRPIEVEGGRDFALGCMRNGLAALCIEQRSLGERREQRQARTNLYNPCHDAAMRALMLGRTLLGERVYDVDRALDYLASRGDADMARVGIMGNSGGGTVAVYAAAMLPRIAFLLASCCLSTFRDSIMSIYHCTDNYVPGLYALADMPDVLGLFAPRPVVVVSGSEDPIFPHEGTARAFHHLQAIYAAAGAPERCRWVVGEGGHRFYPDEAWPVARELIDHDDTC
jgi:dienelactone hydrolase